MIRNKKVLGISILAVIVIAIGITIFVANKDRDKGGLTVFEVNSSRTVSYTHLDVYKRQVLLSWWK